MVQKVQPCEQVTVATWEYCNGTAWANLITGSAGSAAGSSGQVQFNNAGAFGASANLFWSGPDARRQ